MIYFGMLRQFISILGLSFAFIVTFNFNDVDSSLFNNSKIYAADVSDAIAIKSISPTSEDLDTKIFSQIIINLSKPVPLAQQTTDIPVTITPELKCSWQWINNATVACNIETGLTPIAPATTYSIKIKHDDKMGHAKVDKDYLHTITTQRLKILDTTIIGYDSRSIPVVQVSFDQAIDKIELSNKIHFMANGDKFDVKLTSIDKNCKFDPKHNPKVTLYDTSWRTDCDEGRMWVVRPLKALPYNTKVSLQIDQGLKPLEGGGAPTLKAQRVEITEELSKDFTIKSIGCINPEGKYVTVTDLEKADCALDYSGAQISVNFTSPTYGQDIQCYILANLFSNKEQYVQTSLGKAIYARDCKQPTPRETAQRTNIVNSVNITLSEPDAKYTLKLGGVFNYFKRAIFTEKGIPQDIFGRKFTTKPISIKTSHVQPDIRVKENTVLYKFNDTDVDISSINVDKLSFGYDAFTATPKSDYSNSPYSASLYNSKEYSINSKRNKEVITTLEIRKLLNNQSGFIYGVLSPNSPSHQGHDFFAEITNYQIQAKIGYYKSLVWVTDLISGEPVKDATVSIFFPRQQLKFPPVTTDLNGIALIPGYMDFKQFIPTDNYSSVLQPHILVQKEGELSVLPISYQFRSESRYFPTPLRIKDEDYFTAWGITAEGIYKPGDNIKYKIYLRQQIPGDLVIPNKDIEYHLKLVDSTGKIIHEIPKFTLSEFGAISGEAALSKQAATGWYTFELTVSGGNEYKALNPMRVLVSDYIPPTFKISTTLDSDKYKVDDRVSIVTESHFYSGGAYNGASTKVNASLKYLPFYSEHPLAKGFIFNTWPQQNSAPSSYTLFENDGTLDQTGKKTYSFVMMEQKGSYGEIEVESIVQNERSISQSDIKTALYFGYNNFVGLQGTKWVYESGKEAVIKEIVVDKAGIPTDGLKVHTVIERERREVGKIMTSANGYIPEYSVSWELISSCDFVSKKDGADECKFIPKQAGIYRVTATIIGGGPNANPAKLHSTNMNIIVSGSEYFLWQEKDPSLEIIPEKETYTTGEVAKYLIKNPYKGGYALITIEQSGIIDSFVKQLDDSAEIIEIPIKENYVPGFHISASIFMPGDTHPDKAKNPEFRTGHVTTKVLGNKNKIEIKTDKKKYTPGERVELEINTSPKQDLTVIVLDNAVHDLLSNKKYFDIYEGFTRIPDLDIINYTLINHITLSRQLVGFANKGFGSDGGAFAMRSIEKALAYWNPSIISDAKGRAFITFTLPDNITEWRIMVLSANETNNFGFEAQNILAAKNIEIRSVMPTHVTENDKFNACFILSNKENTAYELTANMNVNGKRQLVRKITLQPLETEKICTNIEANSNNILNGRISFSMEVQNLKNSIVDALSNFVEVSSNQYPSVGLQYGSLKDQEEIFVPIPGNVSWKDSSIDLRFLSSVIGDLSEIFHFMSHYPYSCMEQKLSTGLTAAYYSKYMHKYASSFTWETAELLPQNTLNQVPNFQNPDGGITYFKGWDSNPYLSAYASLVISELKSLGYEIQDAPLKELNSYLKEQLGKTNADEETENLATIDFTVKALILAALTESKDVPRDKVLFYKEHINNMTTLGQAYYLYAVSHISENTEVLSQVIQTLFNHVQYDSGTAWFKEANGEMYKQIFASELSANCAALNAILNLDDNKKDVGIPDNFETQLVRGITKALSQKSNPVGNTHENALCTAALYKYAIKYDKNTTQSGIVNVSIGGNKSERLDLSQLIHGKFVQTKYDIKQKDLAKDIRIKMTREIGMKVDQDPSKDQKSETNIIQPTSNDGIPYSITYDYYKPIADIKQLNFGFGINKEYSIWNKDHWELLSGKNEPININPGDLVRSDIYVIAPSTRYFVVVEDYVPGGLEVMNEFLASTPRSELEKKSSPLPPSSMFYNKALNPINSRGDRADFWQHASWYTEIHNNAVRFYVKTLPAGKYHLVFLAQASIAGEFMVAPALVEEMYYRDVRGNTAPIYFGINNVASENHTK